MIERTRAQSVAVPAQFFDHRFALRGYVTSQPHLYQTTPGLSDVEIAGVSQVATPNLPVPDLRVTVTESVNVTDAFRVDLLHIIEVNADERISAIVAFDPNDFEAALRELDARYLAGEAAAHANTWSVIMQGFASLNRRELPPTTPDWVNIDHRRGTSIAPGEMPALLGAAWNVTSDLSNFIEAVHRLDNLGAVMTHVANETSPEGFH